MSYVVVIPQRPAKKPKAPEQPALTPEEIRQMHLDINIALLTIVKHCPGDLEIQRRLTILRETAEALMNGQKISVKISGKVSK